jgi:hypothetical protein
MLGNHAWKSSFAMLSNAEQFSIIYMDLCWTETRFWTQTDTFLLYLVYNQKKRTRLVLQLLSFLLKFAPLQYEKKK